MSDEIVCVGELLWDALPDGLFLGGAPFNVACHLHALGANAAFASRVGDDRLGTEALRRLRARGLDDALVQVDDTLPTGFVRVDLDATGEPDYDILRPVAWDAITLSDSLRRRADGAVLVYGSLAQRAEGSRRTIRALFDHSRLRVFDVNMRPPYVDRAVIEASLRAADVVKLNDAELDRLRDWFDLPAETTAGVSGLASTFDCDAVCVTRGGEGAVLRWKGEYWSHPGYAAEVEDTVGAGDAFLAALLSGLLDDRDGASVLDLANRLGAYVASRAGAFPAYAVSGLDDLDRVALPEQSPSDAAS